MPPDRHAPTPPRVHRVDRADGTSRPHRQAEAGRHRTADELEAFDDRGQGDRPMRTNRPAGENARD